MYKIAKDNLPKLYDALQNIGTLLLPCKNKSGHADFAPYREDAEIALDAPLTNRSAKDVFFPQVENLLTFKTSGKELALEQNVPPAGVTIVMGVRACDARSFKILDKVFLKAPVDTYYKTRREQCVLIGLGCSAPEETCFCHAFGIDIHLEIMQRQYAQNLLRLLLLLAYRYRSIRSYLRQHTGADKLRCQLLALSCYSLPAKLLAHQPGLHIRLRSACVNAKDAIKLLLKDDNNTYSKNELYAAHLALKERFGA